MSCKYRDVLEQISILLQKLGIFAYILAENKPARILHSKVNGMDYLMGDSKLYVLYICNGYDIVRFRENIHLKIKYKKERIDSYKLSKHQINYFENLDFVYREDNHKGKFFKGKTLHNLKSTKIKSIEYLG